MFKRGVIDLDGMGLGKIMGINPIELDPICKSAPSEKIKKDKNDNKHKKRKNFSQKTKKLAREREKDCCEVCGKWVEKPERDYHHRNGDNSDDSLENCAFVHNGCHRQINAKKIVLK